MSLSEYWLNDGTFHLSLVITQFLCLGGVPNVQKWLQLLNYSGFVLNSSCSHFENLYPNLIGLSDRVRKCILVE